MKSKYLIASVLSGVLILSPIERGMAYASDFAAGALIGGLIGSALQGGGKRRQSSGTRSRLPSTQEGREIQSSLNYFGFNVGRVDGQLGRKSKEAISQYQAYLGYPVSGQLSPYEQELLVNSYQRAIASGHLAVQQSMANPDGARGLLKIYLAERSVPQPNYQQQFNQAPTMMVGGNGQQQYVQPQGQFANQNINTYGVQQQYGQAVPQQPYGTAPQPTVQTYGAPQQFIQQGQFNQQGQFVQQGQVTQQGQFNQQGQFVQQGQVTQQGQFNQQGQFAQQGQINQQGQGAQQGQVIQQQPAQVMAAVQGDVLVQQPVTEAAGANAAVTQAVVSQVDPKVVPNNRRWALVIGVDNYENLAPLKKARNDAMAVSAELKNLGFEVRTLFDPARREINSAVSTMANQIDPGDEVLFYFAGHGVEVDGRNFLLPSDVPMINLGDESYLTGESIAADRVLDNFQKQGSRTTVMILDACRNNPFPSDGKRSVGSARGLVRMSPPEGAFILYSAGAGQTALDRLSDDDADPNSVFTRALLPRLMDPNITLHQLAKQVRRDVQDLASTVNHDQFPAYYDQMSGDLFLARTAAVSNN